MLALSEALLIAGLGGLLSFFGALVAVRIELRYLRRAVDAAHKRLDLIGAPASAWSIAGDAGERQPHTRF